ncbi:relaxase/mobilization nuclease domain-containing protein [Oligella urethralis]|uniref:relaxase/mobilization nuclease domain-containing protein n=1 Tax=Oligella urethralis TaxID=90245 RepID=UPI00036D8AB5|nr:relaxase/mobilization nuclease domain-containing protein [Oligella urethralis]SUA67692.1 type IV secretion system T-DNA border endonuclease VirD2 [Oligella urethralis]
MSINYRADNWLLGKERSIKPKQSGGGGGSGRQLRPGTAVDNLKAAALKKPEVMVKIPRRKSTAATGMKAAKGHIDYISRNGTLPLEDEKGNILKGKTAINKGVIDQWKAFGIPEKSRYKETLNVVLSMPPGTPPEAVKDAAREFAKQEFKDHHYVFVQHLDEAHPHVHLCVTMRDFNGKRMNPRKNDLYEWRLLFAEKLREQGVDCAATKRQHRGVTQKAENSMLFNMKKRGVVPRVTKIQAAELIEAIRTNKRPVHPQLKEMLDSRNFIVEQYGQLSKELYMAGFKTEARAISKLAKEVSNKPVLTKAQELFDKAGQSSRTSEIEQTY